MEIIKRVWEKDKMQGYAMDHLILSPPPPPVSLMNSV